LNYLIVEYKEERKEDGRTAFESRLADSLSKRVTDMVLRESFKLAAKTWNSDTCLTVSAQDQILLKHIGSIFCDVQVLGQLLVSSRDTNSNVPVDLSSLKSNATLLSLLSRSAGVGDSSLHAQGLIAKIAKKLDLRACTARLIGTATNDSLPPNSVPGKEHSRNAEDTYIVEVCTVQCEPTEDRTYQRIDTASSNCKLEDPGAYTSYPKALFRRRIDRHTE